MEKSSFCAFISYRHYSPDMEIAKKLHTLIENYTIPAGIRGEKNQKHPGKVFRDQEELPLSADLGRDIETALDRSEWLICICSPRYLQSRWCMRELEYFLENHSRERVLTVLAEGDPQESFPELMRYEANAEGERVPVEPLAADVRGASLRESLKKLKKEKLRLLAPMLGTSYDGLYQRQRRRAVTRGLTVFAAAAAVTVGLTGFFLAQNRRIESERIASAQSEYDLLLEQAASALSKGQRKQAAEAALRARDISVSLNGYREEALGPVLSEACYGGDFSTEVSLQSSIDFLAVSSIYTTEYFSPDGRKVLCPSSAYTLDCCDAATGELLWSSRFREEVSCARWKADGSQVVATAHQAHTVRVLDAQTGEIIQELNSIPWVSGAAFSGDDIILAFEQGFLVWHTREDPEGQQMAWHMKEQFGQLSNAQVMQNGRFIARHTEDAFGVLDLKRGEDQEDYQGYIYQLAVPKVINGYTVSPDGKRLFVHQFDRVFVCDLETDETLWSVEKETGGRWPDGIAESAGAPPVWAGDFIFDNERNTGDYLAYTGTVYDANTGKILYTLEECCTGTAADGQYFLCSGGLRRAETGELAAAFPYRLYAADPEGKYYLASGTLVAALGRGSQYTVEKYAGSLYAERNEAHRCVSPDDQYTVLEEPNGQGFTVMKMDGSNDQYLIRDFTPQWWITFSGDSRLVALGTHTSAVAVYELATGNRLFMNTDWVTKAGFGGFTFDQEGKWLMYANHQKTWFGVASMKSGKTVYEMHAIKPVRDWGFDGETGDAVILYEDGSALCADIFTTPGELYAYAEQLIQIH